MPLCRQCNPYVQTRIHNYTTSLAENDGLISVGWRAEGVAWHDVPAVPLESIDGKRVVRIEAGPASLLWLLKMAPS